MCCGNRPGTRSAAKRGDGATGRRGTGDGRTTGDGRRTTDEDDEASPPRAARSLPPVPRPPSSVSGPAAVRRN